MSLIASPSSGIIIQNSSNVEKFNSNNKLVYRKFSQTGSIVYTGPQVTTISLSQQFDINKDLGVVYITPTSANGNISSQLVNNTIQLGFTLLLHVTYSTTQVQITAWNMLSGGILGAGANSVLRFYYENGNVSSSTTNSSISFDWKLVVLSYR